LETGLDWIVPWLLVIGLYYPFRSLERWLHQHLFKVGWLLTKNLHTTTILYYTFFLPGVILHEIVLWLVAGVLNVRADRAIDWPEKQDVAELRLNFVKLSKKVSPLRLAVISTAPLVAGLAVVLYVAINVLHVDQVFSGVRTVNDFFAALGRLTVAPAFWWWVYLMFAISNTMMPDPKALRGWLRIVWWLIGVVVVLVALGLWNELVLTWLRGPIATALNTIAGTLAVIIGVDLFMVAVLGTIEASIERITGNSATFKDGKLIAMTRAEIQAMQEQQRRRERQLATRKTTTPALAGGPPTIYAVLLPIPGAPGKEPVTQLPTPVAAPAKPSPSLAQRPAPNVIESEAKPAETPPRPPAPSPSPFPRPALPSQASKPAEDLDDDEEQDEDEDDDLTYEPAEDTP
jgi:hypothetical protein